MLHAAGPAYNMKGTWAQYCLKALFGQTMTPLCCHDFVYL